MAEGSGASGASSAGTSSAGTGAQSAAPSSSPSGGSEAKAPAGEKSTEKAEPAAKETATAPEEAPKPVEHKYADRLKKAFPDRKFEKGEDYDSAMEEHLTSLEGYREKGQIANKKLMALFDSEPAVGKVVQAMMNGATFREALARHISPEDLTAVEGDPDYEGWTKNKNEREESAKKRRQFETDYSNNLQASSEEISKFAEENGMQEADVNELLESIDTMISDFHAGKITKDHLSLIRNGRKHAQDVQKAKEDGEIAGKNQKIVAEKETKKTQGDGLPRPGASGEVAEPARPRENYFAGLAEKEKGRRTFQ